ncbi:MAG: hypothetical protein M3Y87_22395 [Myxococcota bacterium]|nr:hypothetical protein [Myxococcota bacterium]
MLTSRLAATLCPLVLAAGCAASTEAAPTAEGLTVSTDTAAHIRGTFRDGPYVLTFESAHEGPRVELEVVVNGQPLDAQIDLEAESMRWSGHNGALTQEDEDTLLAFGIALVDHVAPVRDETLEPSFAPHVEHLLRRVSYWSMAPVGLTLGDRVVVGRAEREAGERVPPEGAFVLAEGHDETTHETAIPGPEVDRQGRDEDGVWYLYCNRHSTATHDSRGHCKTWESVYGGPRSSNCHGKCGPGCTWGLTWGYTYDCHDHDRCGRVHGGAADPWDSECGDEYWEADDDYLWSRSGYCR